MFHSDDLEDRTPTWQSQETDARTNMSNSKQECVIESDASKIMIMKSSQDSIKGKTWTRSG